MMFEQNVLKDLVVEYIKANKSDKDNNIQLKTYLIKEEGNASLSIFDKDNSIKCLFNKEFFNAFISSDDDKVTSLIQLSDRIICIKNAFFDVLLNKISSSKSISVEVVLCINKFELESNVSKKAYSNDKYINVNHIREIEEMVNMLYFNYIQEKINRSENNLNHHLSLNAENFIKSKFNKERDYCSVKKIIPKKSSFNLLNSDKDDFIFDINDYSGGLADKENGKNANNNSNNNISCNVKYKVLFFKHPSQEGRTKKDFTQYEKINLKELTPFNIKNNPINNNKDNLGQITEREENENNEK